MYVEAVYDDMYVATNLSIYKVFKGSDPIENIFHSPKSLMYI